MRQRRAGRLTALLGATILSGGALGSGPAFAQSQTGEPSVVGEVIVTARKREESLQDVPMAVSAISGETLEKSGQSNLADVGRLAPNVFFEAADRSRPYIYIRGIGTRSYDPGSDSSVGVFIDGVYQARLATLDTDLLDVERIEVLRGPQGTLYGKNTIAGAISVVSRDPTPTFRARANAEYGHSEINGDNLYGIWGDVSGPISEQVSVSLAAAHRYRDGYQPVSNLDIRGGSENSYSLRGKVKIDFDEKTTLRLTGWYNDYDGPPIIFVVNTLNGTRPTVVAPAPGVVVPPQAPPYHPASDRSDIHLDKEIYGGAATLNWSWGEVDFTSITAYQHLTIDELWESDSTILNSQWAENPEKSDQFSEELRASYTGERLSWLVGVFYAREKANRTEHLVFGPDSLLGFLNGANLVIDANFRLKTTSYAAFGQLTYDFTDRISATVGGRYSSDKKDAYYNTTTNSFLLPSFPAPVDLAPRKWESFDPSVSLTYKFTDDVSVYGSVATGYKSGSFQFIALSPAVAELVVRPETVTSYEVGLKSTILDGRMRFNVTGFYMDYKDLQTFRLVPTFPTPSVRLANAEKAKIKGIEIETLTALGRDWTVGFNYSYLDAKYGQFNFSPTLDFTGNRLQRAPKHTVNASVAYTHDFEIGRVDARLTYYWRDKIFFEADENVIDPQSDEPSLGVLDGSVSLSRGPWTFTLWGTNLTDERYRRSVLNSTGNAQRELWAEPRTVGLRASVEFN